MEFKIGDKVKVKDVNDLVKKGRCDEETAKRISGVVFEIIYIDQIFSPVGHAKMFVSFSLKDKTGFTIYCKSGEIEKCDETSHESIKNDRKDNKVMMELLPWPELEEIAKVYTAGAKKYGPHNWENLPDGYERYKGAMLRHLTEVEKGNDIDPEAGCLHAAQVAWNAIAMLHFKMKEIPDNANDVGK